MCGGWCFTCCHLIHLHFGNDVGTSLRDIGVCVQASEWAHRTFRQPHVDKICYYLFYILKSSLEYSPQDVGIRNTPPEFTTGFLKHIWFQAIFSLKELKTKDGPTLNWRPKGDYHQLVLPVKTHQEIKTHKVIYIYIHTASVNSWVECTTWLWVMVSDRIIESSKVGKKGRVPTAAFFTIINYSCKKCGKFSKRHLQHFPLHSNYFI